MRGEELSRGPSPRSGREAPPGGADQGGADSRGRREPPASVWGDDPLPALAEPEVSTEALLNLAADFIGSNALSPLSVKVNAPDLTVTIEVVNPTIYAMVVRELGYSSGMNVEEGQLIWTHSGVTWVVEFDPRVFLSKQTFDPEGHMR